MKISAIWVLLRGIYPNDPLVNRWLALKGYQLHSPMFSQPGLCCSMTLRMIRTRTLIGIWVALILISVLVGIGTLMVAVNAFSPPKEISMSGWILLIIEILTCICIALVSMRSLIDSIESDACIEHEIKALAETQKCAVRLREALFIEPNESMSAIWSARLLYESFRDRSPVPDWEVYYLFERFEMECVSDNPITHPNTPLATASDEEEKDPTKAADWWKSGDDPPKHT